MRPPPKLQVFCPVNPALLESTPNGAFCHKCRKGLVDVTLPENTNIPADGVCGVMRRIVAPAIGATIALSGCGVDSGRTVDRKNDMETGPIREKEIVVPGSYVERGGKALNPEDFPVAQRTEVEGIVISPHSRSRVDVSHIEEGTLVLDPAYRMEDRKYFRVPGSGAPRD